MTHTDPKTAAKRDSREASAQAPADVRVSVRELGATEIRAFFVRCPLPVEPRRV